MWTSSARPELDRRRFLTLAGGAALLAGCTPGDPVSTRRTASTRSAGDGGWGGSGELVRSQVPLPSPFTVALPIPPIRRPVDGRIAIVQRVAEAEILPGRRTGILGYDGIFPGPTIETRSGEPVTVVHTNQLPVPTVTHLHGGHTPPDSDGWPADLLLPADGGWDQHGMPGDLRMGSREHHYPMNQRAATLWYHDHRMDFTGPQVYRGLAGFHLIRDAEEDALGLPSGDRELPLMICDRSFGPDGEFSYPSIDPTLHTLPGVENHWMEGVLGDVILVNGAPWPIAEVDAARYRLRLLNASNARRYRLALSPGGEFVQIGSDGGLLAAPASLTTLDIASGERFDVIVDFSRYPVGSEVTLLNQNATGAAGRILRFKVARAARDDSRVPDTLSHVEPLVPDTGSVRREWKFARGTLAGAHTGWTINGRAFDPARVDALARLGDLEIWRISSSLDHSVHVHLDQFQVLDRRGGPPRPEDAGWKDTVHLRSGDTVTIAVRFTDYPGRYVFHCHNLEHEDMAMMAVLRTT